MRSTSSPLQITIGVVLGILLQPVSLWLVGAYITATRTGEARGWALMGAAFLYVVYFGMAQILTILPAALLFLPSGKHGVVRGLLGVGTFLAIANIAVLIFIYLFGGEFRQIFT